MSCIILSALMAKTRGGVMDALVYVLVRAFMLLLGVLPRGLAYRLCEGLAVIVYHLDARHRRICHVNLQIAFPDRDRAWRERVARRSFQELGRHAVEISRLQRLNVEDIRRRVRYEPGRGLENYRQAKQSGGSVLYLAAHVSAWELLPLAQAVLGNPLSFVGRPLDNPYLERWISRLRNQQGNRVLSKFGSMRQVLEEIREGRDVGFLIDQHTQKKEALFVPLFGRPASTHSGLAALALKTSLPVIAAFIYPGSARGEYVIRFYPALHCRRSEDPEEDVKRCTARFNRYIEEVVREHPHCWLWGHRRFQTQPDGSDPYAGGE